MRLTAFTAVAALIAGAAMAETIHPDDVQYSEWGEVEVSLTGVPGDPVRGEELMVDRAKGNCVACHEVAALDYAPFHGEVGPMLSGVGAYRTEAELRGIVANAKKMFPGSVMPAFYKVSGFVRPGDGYTGKAAQGEPVSVLTAQEVEDVVAYLLTLQD